MTVAVFASKKYHMVLTEQAWRWIDKTEDILLVNVLLVELLIDKVNKLQHVRTFVDIRNAMFENKLITQRILIYMGDDAS